MNKQAALRLIIACSAAAALVAAGWLLLPKARAAPAGEGGPAALARSEEVSEAEAILREFVPLKEKLDAYATQPGWTLLRYEQHDKIAWDSPKPLPAPHERETWLHLNEKRQVFEAVSYALAPELGRVLIYYVLNGEQVSVWHGERWAWKPYAWTPDMERFLELELAALGKDGGDFEVASREDILEGRSVWVIDIKDELSAEARQFGPHFDQPLWGEHERVFVDRESGMVVHYEHTYILEDGSLIPGGTVTTREITANLEPPAEVLEVLRKASMGEDVR